MFYILAFFCFFLNSNEFFFNPLLNYDIADYAGTIKQHLGRANAATMAGRYNDSLHFFRWIEHTNGNFDLLPYADVTNNNAGHKNYSKYKLVVKYCTAFIDEGNFAVYQFPTSSAVTPIQTWVILNCPLDSGKVIPLMTAINYHKKMLDI